MNSNRKITMPEINRKVYKDVKSYDRQQFQKFCNELYMCGVKDGLASAVDVEQVYEAIKKVKGIGEKRLAEIKTNIEAVFKKGETADEQH